MCKRAMRRMFAAGVGFASLLMYGLSQANPPEPPREFGSQKFLTDCWEIHSLGTLGGRFSVARDLNNAGQVVGNAETEPRIFDNADPPMAVIRPFISAPNGGALMEILTAGKFFGFATAINKAGQVVGTTTIGSSFPVSFITDPGGTNVRTTIGFSVAQDINNVGQTLFDLYFSHFQTVVGDNEQSDIAGTNLIDVTVPVTDPLNAFISSVALNDAGQVAVNAGDFGAPTIAYRWSLSEGAVNIAPDATSSNAADMNNAGQVVGTLVRDGVAQAFLTRHHSNSLIMFGKPGDDNQPTGINIVGQVVGTKNFNGVVHGYVTPPFNVRRTIDLDALEVVTRDAWSRLQPVGINDRGQIAGTGILNGQDRAFLLTPQSQLAYLADQHGNHAKCFRPVRP